MYFRGHSKRKAIFIFLSIVILSLGILFFVRKSPPKQTNYINTLSVLEYTNIKKDLFDLVDKQDPKAALDKLVILMKNNSAANGSCHALVHEIGHRAFEKYGDFGKAMLYHSDLCGSGYLHGIIESKFKSSEDIDNEMNTVCAGYDSFTFTQRCYHGVGHGLMYFTNNDVDRSIEMCATYKSNVVKVACSEGVFMENFSTDLQDHKSLYLKPEDPSYPCMEQNTFYKGSCYFYSPIYYLSLHNDDYKKGLEWCLTIDPAFKNHCASGMGSRAIKEYMNDKKTARDICENADKSQVGACIDGMVGYNFTETNSLDEVQKMCPDFTGINQKLCLSSVNIRRTIFKN